MTTREETVRKVVEQLTREATRQGKIIELGWLAMRAQAIPADAPDIQIREMRNAFFAGAQHLYASIMTVMDEGSEPTEADLARLGQIADELDTFLVAYKREHGLP